MQGDEVALQNRQLAQVLDEAYQSIPELAIPADTSAKACGRGAQGVGGNDKGSVGVELSNHRAVVEGAAIHPSESKRRARQCYYSKTR